MSKEEKFNLNFVGFSGMGSLDRYEATIVIPPQYDIVGVVSSLFFADGSRGITIQFKRTEAKLGRRGYRLEQQWEQLPNGQSQLQSKENKEMQP